MLNMRKEIAKLDKADTWPDKQRIISQTQLRHRLIKIVAYRTHPGEDEDFAAEDPPPTKGNLEAALRKGRAMFHGKFGSRIHYVPEAAVAPTDPVEVQWKDPE